MTKQIFITISLFFTCSMLLAETTGLKPPNTEFYYDIEGEMLWMKRSKLNTVSLVDYDGYFGEIGTKQVGTQTLVHDLDKQFVGRITAIIKPNQKNLMEGRFTTPAHFVSDVYIEDNQETNIDANIALGYYLNANTSNPLPTPLIDFDNTDYVDANKAHLHYETNMYTMEGNYWTYVTPPRINYFAVAYGFGLRFINVHEIFRETFYQTQASSFFRVQTDNQMWGAQVLGRLEVNPYSFMTWGIRATGAVLGNNISMVNHVTDHNGTTDLKYQSLHELYYGYLGEVETYLTGYFLKRFNWRLGLDGILLRGAALAPPNINLTTKITPIDKDVNIIFLSWTVGLGWDF
ncbi:MAG: hypothetical protein K9M07_02220 [Simkaniaceae bacterium]|nr:hypothetical protein [Simkaniaceae bacterium]MCF7852037.1 hypothetical protein [Simkaniaceae bacterium]